ncbi:MAG: caspase family protein [Oscillospiraceae bacterium]|nr:caspase family protein [Oscillospiraceae bacterium]
MLKKIALCIGNDDYQFSCLGKLQCAVKDSRSMALKLRTLGFDVVEFSNLKRVEMHQAIEDFEKRLDAYDVGMFYYAGHGFESKGNNLLMPIDTNGTDEGYSDYMALKLEFVINALEGNNIANNLRTKIIILDACRQKPSGRGAVYTGFASIFSPKGSIIAFSTSPGQFAHERDGHGLYTKALLSHIDIPRVPIENMFKHVRETLDAETNGHQISWEHTSLMGNFYFNEDRIDSGIVYSNEAFADRHYRLSPNHPISGVITDLKSLNWYIQNPAISKITKMDFQNVSANDLFVLGRNIYQASTGDGWGALRFINDFDNIAISNGAKTHILNGMAYEIYFNSDGILRVKFKSERYVSILRLLEMETYQASKLFISEKLGAIADRVLYIPGSEDRVNINIKCSQEDANGLSEVYSIHINGIKVFDALNDDYYTIPVNQDRLRKTIAEAIVAPLDMIVIKYSIRPSADTKFAVPYDLRLNYNS